MCDVIALASRTPARRIVGRVVLVAALVTVPVAWGCGGETSTEPQTGTLALTGVGYTVYAGAVFGPPGATERDFQGAAGDTVYLRDLPPGSFEVDFHQLTDFPRGSGGGTVTYWPTPTSATVAVRSGRVTVVSAAYAPR